MFSIRLKRWFILLLMTKSKQKARLRSTLLAALVVALLSGALRPPAWVYIHNTFNNRDNPINNNDITTTTTTTTTTAAAAATTTTTTTTTTTAATNDSNTNNSSNIEYTYMI